ncbi:MULTISPECIES: DUF805 domain-containing protein [unclassified Flavobacterium]|jgi:uncharacterized membrane protein YhaH (DUF805 family)|uniref:DUF805 domain-containing protein n=1 Tax=unclassified Flavobacterium TaxID=196869 RepID=UPI00064B1188|nr:DUF805 domain-containing protein [Flavobacterium sp. ABG]KLT69462.1 hypothetical protein AB674_12480 [Flavobacterium sp. ABG]
MIEWYKKVVFENYANFSGRARRSEYWYYCLASALISMILGVLDYFANLSPGGLELGVFRGLYGLVVFIPGLAVMVRRLHDVGKSGWFIFIILIPLIGVIWFFISLCTEGDDGQNEYGADPKDEFDEMDEIGKELA